MNFSQEPKLWPWQELQTVELNIRCAHKATSLHPSAESFTSEVIHEDALPVSLELLNITFHVYEKLVFAYIMSMVSPSQLSSDDDCLMPFFIMLDGKLKCCNESFYFINGDQRLVMLEC